jgi:uncharacterized membrane protein YgaE (UPF0421/DUF939 family)
MSGRLIRTPALWARQMTTPARLLMALKAGVAAALAWVLAPFLPLAEDQYSYYAPLGVLVSMYPTIAASTRSGAQALLGLALGIALGLAGIAAAFAGVPAVLTLGVMVTIGVMFGGIRVLGAGRDWVAIAALFVLLLSGSSADDFSLSYLITMAFGVVVGVITNLVLLPPVYLHEASGRLSDLRDTVAGLLRNLAARAERDEVDAADLEGAVQELDVAIADVHDEVHEADESLRGNPRSRRHRGEQAENLQRLRALERTAFYTRDLLDVLEESDSVHELALSAEARQQLARAIRACADLVETPVNDSDARARVIAADEALDAYVSALAKEGETVPASSARRSTPAVFLRRIIDASLPFVPADD